MENGQTQKAERKRSWDEIFKMRQKIILENPQSIVFVPRTIEGMILGDLIFSLDWSVGRIRQGAGTFIPVESVVAALKKVEGFIKEFSDFVNSTFSDGSEVIVYESIESKKTLASIKRAIVINPRTLEASEVARLVKRLDPALIILKNTCTDFSKTEKVFKKLVDFLLKFDSLVKELYDLLKRSYRRPKLLKKLVSVISPELSENEPGKPDLQVQESSGNPQGKGKKIGG